MRRKKEKRKRKTKKRKRAAADAFFLPSLSLSSQFSSSPSRILLLTSIDGVGPSL